MNLGPHACRLPGSTCSPAAACPGSLATYDLAPRTGSFAKPGAKDGTITIFTEPSGDVVVTVTLQCNCFISVVGANGNTVNLGPDGACPANLNGFTDPTSTAATGTPVLVTCMSWVLPKARVEAALAASGTPGAVVITSHFAVSCYSGCSSVAGTATATQVLSSGPAGDVRCNLSPFRGVLYRPATDCAAPPVPASGPTTTTVFVDPGTPLPYSKPPPPPPPPQLPVTPPMPPTLPPPLPAPARPPPQALSKPPQPPPGEPYSPGRVQPSEPPVANAALLPAVPQVPDAPGVPGAAILVPSLLHELRTRRS
jgi:hypothetical protein